MRSVILKQVDELIQQDEELQQSLQASPRVWPNICDSYHSIEQDVDGKMRPIFVGLQGKFEQAITQLLVEGVITAVVGVIHTATPATPLCTKGKDITTALVAEEILKDPLRLKTVTERVDVVRAYMQAGGFLVANYPAENRTKRSEDQLGVFEDAKKDFSEQLLDLPMHMSAEALPKEISGATYLIKLHDEDEPEVFALMASQANSPGGVPAWGLWSGPVSQADVAKRFDQIDGFLKTEAEFVMTEKLEERCQAKKSQAPSM